MRLETFLDERRIRIRGEEPFRAELYTVEKLSEEARHLASRQEVSSDVPHPKLLDRILENEKYLRGMYFTIRKGIAADESFPPGEEWLYDNFHFVEEQLRQLQEDMPRHFYRELPSVASGPFAGLPRVYEMAVQVIAHTDSRFNALLLRQYIHSFQEVSPLTTGELWAFAILLRIGLIENLRRFIEQAEGNRQAILLADRYAERLITDFSIEKDTSLPFGKGALSVTERSFAAQLIIRLRDAGSAAAPALNFILEKISKEGLHLDDLIREKHQELATSQLSVSNTILSLRLLAGMDWSEIVENTSLVDNRLREDPTGSYPKCDFATRDHYRHVVEAISKKSKSNEIEVADAALQFARDAMKKNPSDFRRSHVGYYLIDKGRKTLEKKVGFEPGLLLKFRRIVETYPMAFYQLPIGLLTVFFLCLIFQYSYTHATVPVWTWIAVVLFLLPASALSVNLVNWAVTMLKAPTPLPKLDLKDGIPAEYHTIVVLPTLLTGSSEIRELTQHLEIHYLANSDELLDFALLTDYLDSDTEENPDDEKLLREVSAAISSLNRKYPRSRGNRFHFFHRKRQWNQTENKWMGWERKRGKLEEFNRLLLGDSNTTFLPSKVPVGVQFIITLDSDTILPRDTARRLVGTMAHPLNRANVDPQIRHVVEGYGILQPRISHTLTSANRTWFSRAFSGTTGIDPYTTAVSDIYQDLFKEASFVGKGIYDLRAFHECLHDRFPENTLLSHDLIEGAFARTGLVSDVELFDDHPSDYITYAIRLHRWVRGDWQILSWLRKYVLNAKGERVRNTLSWLNQWKLLDNLRRSLVTPFTLIALLAGWTILPGVPLFWTLFLLATLFSPILLQLVAGAFTRSKLTPWMSHLWAVISETRVSLLHSLMKVAFLADEAMVVSDAILRTLYRMIRKRNMLEWMTAALAERSSRGRDLSAYIRRMFGTQVMAAIFIVLIVRLRPHSMGEALPFLIPWFAVPLLAYLTGKSIPHRERKLPYQAIPYYRSVARDIWRYFETFVGELDHWLPPDNFQETPERIAHRTSPTNIGFLLLSNIAAYDFGYIGSTEFVDRTEHTLASLSRLKTFNGHLYNWYDTRTLAPMEPRYVSTVDSGNLAASLIALRQFVLHFPLPPYPRKEMLEGVRDTLYKLVASSEKKAPALAVLQKQLQAMQTIPENLAERETLLDLLENKIQNSVPVVGQNEEFVFWHSALLRMLSEHRADSTRSHDLISRLKAIGEESNLLVDEMNFTFLFNENNGVFSIGFNVSNGQLDPSFYDLLASEARLTSFIAIAKGDVPQSHWFHLARTMTSLGRRRLLASWSGSMFEFLMPNLLMKNEPNTLLDETIVGAVFYQRYFGKQHNLPWGISEAGYNARDLSLNYQYGPFGVPGLGLKNALDKDYVVAPYATFLAAMVDPAASLSNLEQMAEMGARGKYGFYESIDFTPDRVEEGEQYAIIRSFMAHHQGMSFVALNNVLHQDIMQRRFHQDPAVRATELLLQERIPSSVRSVPIQIVSERVEVLTPAEPVVAREFFSYDITPPRTQILSNGNYLVTISTAGSGYSECRGIQVNRWREDVTRDNWGSFLYIKNVENGTFWSAGYQPTLKVPSFYHAILAEDRVEIGRRDDSIETHLEITVSPEEDAEIRRLTIVNASPEPKELDLASYLELVLAPAADDMAHPAFNNLFVKTEFLSDSNILLATRKPHTEGQKEIWAAHVMMCDAEICGEIEYETDRKKFIGRRRSTHSPQAILSSFHSNTAGEVLDPIFSLRRRITIPAFGRAVAAFTTLVAGTREEVIAMALKYREADIVTRTFELAATHSQLLLKQLSISAEDAQAFQRLAGRLIFSDPSLRPRPYVLSSSRGTQSALWPYGISGDLPICLVRVEDKSELDVVRQVLRAHEYWRLKGFTVDLVIMNEYPSSYFQELQEDLLMEIRSSPSQVLLSKPGGVFLIRADLTPDEDRILLRTVARVQIAAGRGTLARQLARIEAQEQPVPLHVPTSTYPIRDSDFEIPIPPLQFENGFGGFSAGGKEYTIVLREGLKTPAPWINVISNSHFGFQISESGAGMTWSENSRENRLTPWSNDPISDPVDSAIYIRDEESGDFWSATPAPTPGTGTYVVTHGAGYTRFQNGGHGIEQDLMCLTAREHPIKILKLRLRNTTRRARWLSVTNYIDLVLGVWKSKSAPFVVTSIDEMTGALLAMNSYNNEFAGRIVFSSVNDRKRTITGDRTSYLGPNGTMNNPAAMRAAYLSGRVGAGLDPCHALQSKIKLEPFGEHTLVFLLGEGKTLNEVRSLVHQFQNPEAVEQELQNVQKYWDHVLGGIQIETPDRTTDLLLNHWLLYQALSCRFWGRTALYQSGGAFGFRDQLQDALAFVYSDSTLLREHLLRAASRQFPEGDVQHWWHPPTGRGVRTRSSDDLLWLPFAASFYTRSTGDQAIWDEIVPFLDGPPLKPDEAETYFQPRESSQSASLFEHCLRAIDHSLKMGKHGLPLIGSGDWNDGMNQIGVHGRGESVWLGWFLVQILKDFSVICESKCNKQKAAFYKELSETISSSAETHAWDGAWYLRAFTDEGIPIGSKNSPECQIDSIAQSWAVLSGGGDSQRSVQSMESAYKHLVKPEKQMVLLFEPPFQKSNLEPGYIKAYPPGVRENGGHYTHAATWLAAAYAELQNGARAFEVFQYLNPILHSANSEEAITYKVEPYVVSADIYSHPDYEGMGGWSWYTGSAAWVYRLGIEWILGFRLYDTFFTLQPCIPKQWNFFHIAYRHGDGTYHIHAENPNAKSTGISSLDLDGSRLSGNKVPLDPSGGDHIVKLIL